MKIADGLSAGTQLLGGKYTIVEAIGQGGFGITYRAKAIEKVQGPIGQMDVEIDVAIKEFFLKSECERNSDTNQVRVPTKAEKKALIENFRDKFLKEAKNISKLHHNNIVKVINVFEENDTAYYVMQYISGESLESRVENNGPMSEADTMRVIEQLASAIGYIHDRNMTHLDIKPSNIIIDTTGCLKLIDFGLAKHYDSKGKATSMGLVQGVSEGFSPIEQYEQEGVSQFSPQTDIYAVGATMAYLLTGKVPPKSLTMQKPELPADVSERVRSGIYRAMESAKHSRPATIAEFLVLLGGNIPANEHLFGGYVSKDTEVIDTERKPFPTKLVAIAAAVVAAVVVFVLMMNGGSSEAGDDVAVADSVIGVDEVSDGGEVAASKVTKVENMPFTASNNVKFVYTGEVIDSVPNGQGVGKYANGTYTGVYKNGLRTGKATFVTADGSNRFEGYFEDDEYSKGKVILSDGYYFEGEFKNGAPYSGTWFTKNGKPDYKVVNGKDRY